MYIIYNADGSINKQYLNEFIQEGNSYANVLFVAIIGREPADYYLNAFAKLPNNVNIELPTEDSSLILDGITYVGKNVSITSDATTRPGSLQLNIVAENLPGTERLVSFNLYLTVNETGLAVDDPAVMTITQYQSLLNRINEIDKFEKIELTGTSGTLTESQIGYITGSVGTYIKNGDEIFWQNQVSDSQAEFINTSHAYKKVITINLTDRTWSLFNYQWFDITVSSSLTSGTLTAEQLASLNENLAVRITRGNWVFDTSEKSTTNFIFRSWGENELRTINVNRTSGAWALSSIQYQDITTPTAQAVTYDNSNSGLTAENVQEAIDELVPDSELSLTSKKPVQNKVITEKFDEKANKEGNYPDLNAGNLINVGETDITTNFAIEPTANKTDIKDGNAYIKELRGNTIILNQIINLERTSTTTSGVSFTINGQQITCNGTASADIQFLVVNNAFKLLANHKYFMAGCPRNGSATTYCLNAYYLDKEYGEGKLYTQSGGDVNCLAYLDIKAGTVLNNIVFKPIIIDLTLMFGEGNEPTTLADCWNKLRNIEVDIYNGGSLLNFVPDKIKSSGLNAFNEEWEVGSINTADGTNLENNNHLRTKDYITVVGGKEYTFYTTLSATQFTQCYIYEYDKNKTYLGSQVWNRPATNEPNIRTLKANTAFVRVRYYGILNLQGIIPDNQTCIHLTHTGYRNNDYEKYWEREVGFILPSGVTNLKSAGSAYDVLTPKKYIKKIGSVDLGTLDWNYDSSIGFVSVIVGMKLGTTEQGISNTLMPKYAKNNVNASILGDKEYVCGSTFIGDNTIVIRDSSHTDTTTFKAALSGLILNYELNETVEIEIDEDIWFYEVSDYGIEQQIVSISSSPFYALTAYDINLRDKLKNLPSIPKLNETGEFDLVATKTENNNATYNWVKKADIGGELSFSDLQLPILYLTGRIVGMDKDNAVNLNYIFGERSGVASVKWQGSSSIGYPKKNYTIKFDNAFEMKEGWGVQSKYCAKADYIDFSHARNVVSAKLWGKIVKSRATVPAVLASLPNGGAVDGFPIIIVINNEYVGVYNMNIPKDKWLFGMGNGTREAILSAEGTDKSGFQGGTAPLLLTDLDIEYATNESDITWLQEWVNNIYNAIPNCTPENIDTVLGQYIDIDSVIDYLIYYLLIQHFDGVIKNYLLAFFENKCYMSAYDMDSTYGLLSNGKEFVDYRRVNLVSTDWLNKIMLVVRDNCKQRVYNRYKQLRNGVMSVNKVHLEFDNYAALLNKNAIDKENIVWATIPNTMGNNISQIKIWYKETAEHYDGLFEEYMNG